MSGEARRRLGHGAAVVRRAPCLHDTISLTQQRRCIMFLRQRRPAVNRRFAPSQRGQCTRARRTSCCQRYRLMIERLEERCLLSGPSLVSNTFVAGSSDQRGTGIAINKGAIYLSGNVQPETQSASDTALVLSYATATPPGASPAWSRTFDFGTDFFGIGATSEGVYAGGWNWSLSNDIFGAKEVKTMVAKFPRDGSSGAGPGGSTWVAGAGGNLVTSFYGFDGVESFNAVTTAVEGSSAVIYAAGAGQACSPPTEFGSIVAKFSTSDGIPLQALDANACLGAEASAVTVLNGNVYVSGSSGQSVIERPTLWKYDPNLNQLWRQQDTSVAGTFRAETGFGGAIYAVGDTFTPGVVNSEDYLIEKYDEAGNRLWTTTS